MTENENVLIGSGVEDEGGYSHKGVEPSASLVNALAYEVRRELGVEYLLVFKGIVPLREGHRARVKPAVDNLADSLHLAAALGTLDGHLVDEGAVKLYILGAVIRH